MNYLNCFRSSAIHKNDRNRTRHNDKIEAEIFRMKSDITKVKDEKRNRLKNLDLFVLDNSIRESTVGQLRGHTLQNKIDILEQIRKVGIKDIIIAAFSHMTSVDDDFVKYLKDDKQDFTHFYSFAEVTEGVKDGTYITGTIPIAMKKNHEYGIPNTIFEIDLANDNVEWETKFTIDDMCQLMYNQMKWTYSNITENARILFNFRDFPDAMTKAPKRVLYVLQFLSKLPSKERPFAVLFEEPTGESLPEELEAWTMSLRRTMTACGWQDGKILVHVHQKWDLQTAAQLDCLNGGADGVWCSLCEEGAAMGHACSSITIMNLIRLGNTKVTGRYNCVHLRNAAIQITKITTGKPPHPKQVLYGERAIDLVIGSGAMGSGDGCFDLAEFFGIEAPNRMSTLATTEMIVDHLENLFGKNPQFTEDMALKMKELMLEDLRSGRKEEYNSIAGVAVLFDRAGGKLTERMSEVISSVQVKSEYHKSLIAEVRKQWDFWDQKDTEQNDDRLQFDSFYHGFMRPYFGYYQSIATKKGLQALDMNSDGYIDWKEFLVYVKWALSQYPNVADVDELMSIVFRKGLIPAMRDEIVKQGTFKHSTL